jgi:hypothetical protein
MAEMKMSMEPQERLAMNEIQEMTKEAFIADLT